jgi:hypothetical protein
LLALLTSTNVILAAEAAGAGLALVLALAASATAGLMSAASAKLADSVRAIKVLRAILNFMMFFLR